MKSVAQGEENQEIREQKSISPQRQHQQTTNVRSKAFHKQLDLSWALVLKDFSFQLKEKQRKLPERMLDGNMGLHGRCVFSLLPPTGSLTCLCISTGFLFAYLVSLNCVKMFAYKETASQQSKV